MLKKPLCGISMKDFQSSLEDIYYPFGKLTVCYWKLPFSYCRWFTHKKRWFSTGMLVGPPPTNGRGVFVVFLSFCICFCSILSVSRCAYGPFFYLVFSFFFVGGWFGGVRGGVITFCRVCSFWLRCFDATLWTFFLELRTLWMLRCELSC